MKKYKKDIMLIAVMLLVGVVLLSAMLLTQKEGKTVIVEVSGQKVASFPLSEDTTYTIRGANDGTNTLIIENGYARIEEASCPDGLCVHMGRIQHSSQSIVCLPNQVVVRIEGGNDDIDITVH